MTNLISRLLSEIKKQRKRIVVIGDTMTDIWVHGRVESCQDGCPKFVQESVVDTPGGAANAERCLQEWTKHGLLTSLYGQYEQHRPIKTRYVEGEKIVFRSDADKPRYERLCEQENMMAREMALEAITGGKQTGVVLLSDYDKGFLTPEFIQQVVEVCRKAGIPCVADCKREPEVYEGCVLKCNNLYHARHPELIDYNQFVVTHGEGNPITFDNSTPYGLNYDLPSVKCVNHVGAGDCFAAHLVLALAYRFFLKEAAGLAHSAGRVYVQHPHNRPPHPKEVMVDLPTE